jgi:L-ascorbate metabolism protein UlaG (beta-lactamase superfamily)
MSRETFYLRPDAMARPLINQWPAKDHMIPPASAAMYIKNAQVELMQSYLMAPEYHAKAAADPNLVGGPWVGYETDRIGEIEALLDRTLSERARLIEFARGIEKVDKMLRDEAKGNPLEAFYGRVPELLKGYVELVYDLNSHPSIRFIEGLLYRSDFYDPSMQSMALSLIGQDYRPFQWTTPWLADGRSVHLGLPFANADFDELFRLRTTPRPFEEVKELLGLSEEDAELFRSFLTTESSPRRQRYEGDGVRLRYFGHACLLIESEDVSILTDPLVSYGYESPLARYTYADLPDVIDYAVITHGHFDHLYLETLLQLRHRVRHVVIRKNAGGALQDPSLKLILNQIGFGDVMEIDDFESVEFEGGSITALPFLGEHADLDVRSKAAHLLRVKGNSILCAADSCNIEPRLYTHIHRLVGDIDILFLGMESAGAPMSVVYGPLLTKQLDRRHDQARRTIGCDCERGLAIVDEFNLKQAYIYAMGQEPWLRHILPMEEKRDSKGIVDSNRFVAECLQRGIVAERPFAKKEIFLEDVSRSRPAPAAATL